MPAKSENSNKPSEKDELELRLKVLAAEQQLLDFKSRIQRDDIRGIIESYRKMTQGAMLINAAASLVMLNAWANLNSAFGRGAFTAMMWFFAVGVVLGLNSHFLAVLQTTASLEAAISKIDPRRWWSFYLSGVCFIGGIGVGLYHLTWF